MTSLIKKRYFPIVCWLNVALIYMLTYGLLVIPDSIVPELQAEFHVSLSEIGLYASSFLYVWILMQIPAGIMFDRFDSRKLIFISTFIIALACAIQGLTHNFALGIFSRVLMGAASSFSLIGAIYLGRAWFSVTTLPIIIGITQGLSGVTEIGFPVLFANIAREVQWREVILLLGMIVLTLAFLALFYVRDKPVEIRLKQRHSIPLKLAIVFGNKYLWGLGIYIGFAVAYFVSMADMWGIVWLRRQFSLTTVDAVYMNSVVIFGFMIGSPLIGWVSRFLPRRILIMICMLLEYVFLTWMNYAAHDVEAHCIILFLLGFFTGAIVLAFDMAKEIISEQHYGLAVGFLNMFFGAIGVLVTPLIGYILTLHSGSLLYKPLTLQLTGVIAAAMSIFIAWRYKFDKTREFEKK